MAIVHAGKARGLPMAVASGGSRHHVMQVLASEALPNLAPSKAMRAFTTVLNWGMRSA
jgi:hypothetical protein